MHIVIRVIALALLALGGLFWLVWSGLDKLSCWLEGVASKVEGDR